MFASRVLLSIRLLQCFQKLMAGACQNECRWHDRGVLTAPGFQQEQSRVLRVQKHAKSAFVPAPSFPSLTDSFGPLCSSQQPSRSPPYSFLRYGLSSTWLGVPLALTGYAVHSAVSSDAVWTLLLRMSFVEQELLRQGPMHYWFHLGCLVSRSQ